METPLEELEFKQKRQVRIVECKKCGQILAEIPAENSDEWIIANCSHFKWEYSESDEEGLLRIEYHGHFFVLAPRK
jgi:hypothetical protein